MKQLIIGGLILAVVILSVVIISRSNNTSQTEKISENKDTVAPPTPSADFKNSREVAINAQNSQIMWTGRAVGKEHVGTVKIKNGTFNFAESKMVGAMFTIDMSTIADNDLEGAMREKLVTHLKSDDFFSVEKYPEAYVKIMSIEDGADAGYIKANAELTIKGIMHPVLIYGKTSMENGRAKFEGNVTIDRTLWDIKFGSEKFIEGTGVQVIDDNITFNITLVSEEMS